MPVLIVLFASWLILRGIGALGVSALATWHDSVSYALAIMFVFTGIAHFNKMRHDLANMIPSFFPQPMLIVYITGIFEFLGAAGLLVPRFRSLAGICLIVLLIGMFIANVNAALKGVTLRGKPATALWLRTPMQILFIGLIWWASN
ncbi:MAG: DoxX family protein [Terriglobales bacterium]